MVTVDVCSEGLRELAKQCAADSSRLATEIPTAVAGRSAQATVAAVTNSYAALAETATVLANRVRTTAQKLTVSADRYASTDENSARRLSGLGAAPVQG